MVVETIKIADSNKRGFKTINKCNFVSGRDKLYSDKKPPTRRRSTKSKE